MTCHPDPRLDHKRFVLADDHAIVRMGFRLLLEGVGASVLAEADSGEAAQRLVAELEPDVLMMDLSMPGCGGLAALERILARQPATRVLIASAHSDPLTAERAIRAGATGYLCKRSAPDELLRAASLVAASATSTPTSPPNCTAPTAPNTRPKPSPTRNSTFSCSSPRATRWPKWPTASTSAPTPWAPTFTASSKNSASRTWPNWRWPPCVPA